jgi:hypothetical protein
MAKHYREMARHYDALIDLYNKEANRLEEDFNKE